MSERDEYRARIAAQTEALASIGFGPAIRIGGDIFSKEAASCLSCGALVLLAENDDHANPLRVHHAWHVGPAPTQDRGTGEAEQ